MTMVHCPAPAGVQLELKLVKTEPASGVAVSVTVAPLENEAEQDAPQEIPAGLEATVPPPLPTLATASVNDLGTKVAVTVTAVVTVHWVGTPATGVQLELNPLKFELASGAAVRVTVDPVLNDALQVAPQLMPAGLEVTVPPPPPVL